MQERLESLHSLLKLTSIEKWRMIMMWAFEVRGKLSRTRAVAWRQQSKALETGLSLIAETV